jgi:hypothetical protein
MHVMHLNILTTKYACNAFEHSNNCFLGDGFGVKGKKKASTGGLCLTVTGTHSYLTKERECKLDKTPSLKKPSIKLQGLKNPPLQ